MMNRILDFYFKLPDDDSLGILTKAFNRLNARILKRVLDKTVPSYFLKTMDQFPSGINHIPREKKVIVSLTSFPARIKDLWIVIECLLRQSYQADKIILWLARPQFEGIDLPESLVNQQKRGLEIRFVDEDLRSHKKYLFAFDLFPNDYIVTVDDDLYYDEKLLENLIHLKSNFPDAVVTNRAHELTFDSIGNILPYKFWKHNSVSLQPSFFMVQTGGFGTLYSKEDLDQSYNNIQIIKNNIPFADDLWMKVQTLLAGKKVVTNDRYNKDPLTVRNSQLEKLVSKNVFDGGNDQQLRSVLNHFQLGNLEQFREQN
ncbi:hypothetical protein [Shivajiella indica]|uniref:Glycosyltransferase n=1 Tax=Shivajiella indica TaxID=872115 RepID=A0ABW5B9C8_9BACT